MRINIQKSGSAIATGLACIGVIATAILAAKRHRSSQSKFEKQSWNGAAH